MHGDSPAASEPQKRLSGDRAVTTAEQAVAVALLALGWGTSVATLFIAVR